MISWVIGRGGLLGRNVEEALGTNGAIWHPRQRFTWDSPSLINRELTEACRAFAATVTNSSWQIAWCAGTGIVGSDSPELQQETRTFCHLLASITEAICWHGSSPGAMFFASSAGGVYAGSHAPPFNERSPVEPLAPYGWNKLDQEMFALNWSKQNAIPLLVGRLSNLYGPGQNVSKNQGLITQVCVRVLHRQPLILYVPLDTIRDYLFAKDAGRLVADGLERLRLEASLSGIAPSVVKILSSQQPATVSTVLSQLRWITKRPLSVITAESPNTRRQPRDLRMTSCVWPELEQHPRTTLSEGIQRVLTDVLHSTMLAHVGYSGA